MTKTIFSIVAVVLAGGIFFFYTKPTYDSVQGTQQEIAGYNAALDKAGELQKLKQQLLARYNAFSPENIERLQKLLPDHVDNIALILDFDNVAARYGLSLENVDVSTPASGASNQGVIGGGGSRYDSLTLKFSTAGTYNNFKDFLHGLEASLRVVDLVSLSLTPQNAVTPDGEQVYRYDIILRTYWLK